MALSGSVRTNAWISDAGYEWRVLFSWTASQNILTNQTEVDWSLKMQTSQGGYVVCSELKLEIGGEQIYYRGSSNHTNAYNGTVLATGTKTWTHNADGTLPAMDVVVSAGIYQWAINKTGTGSMQFNSIGRASKVSCSTAYIGSNPTITITPYVASYTHTLRYVFKTKEGTIAVKTTKKSYTDWTVPNSFYELIGNALIYAATLYCDTYNGSTLIGTTSTTMNVRVPVEDNKPVIDLSINDINPVTVALTGNNRRVVRYHSDMSYNISATAQNGATITGYSIKNGSAKVSDKQGYFYEAVSGVFEVTAMDSRGIEGKTVYQLPLVTYIKLTCDVWLESVSPDGEATIGVSGNWYNGAFDEAGANNNTLVLEYNFAEQNGELGEWITIPSAKIKTNEHTYEAEFTATGLDYKKTYSFVVRATDALSEIHSAHLPVKCIPVFEWGEEEFRFNVPVYLEEAKIPQQVILSDTRTNGGILLDDSAYNYDKIEIYFSDNNGRGAGVAVVLNPEKDKAKTFDLFLVEASSTVTTYIRRTAYILYNRSLTPSINETAAYVMINYKSVEHVSDVDNGGDGVNFIYIDRVVGYK